jgi:ectoine hydroxylase-related dioxygenase (phytanoyl-CoA dioxygenase family)
MYLLSDFNRAHGGTCFVPGSHKLQRAPIGREGYDERVPVEAKKGSLVVWHGGTWHGSFVKTTGGLRVSTPLLFCRPQLQTLEPIRGRATREMIDRNAPRFRTYVGETSPWGATTSLDLPRADPTRAKSPYGT